jgi:predicted nucleotidyltransferase
MTQAVEAETGIRESILTALRYFHVFKFPLYLEEIRKYAGTPAGIDDIKTGISRLVAERQVFVHDDLYMLDDNAQHAIKRKLSSEKAALRMVEARRSANVIARFPFVKAVCVSGSLSKGYADDRSDIDLFIITAKNRLWICRTLLHIFKKFTFLNNKQHSYCMNYFLDESRPAIEEQNIFTATEIATLIPVYEEGQYSALMEANKEWVAGFFPNFQIAGNSVETSVRNRKIVEAFFNIAFPGMLNYFLMQLTDKWWRLKWRRKNYPAEDYELAMKTRWYVSKNHPANYQKKILARVDRYTVGADLREVSIELT